ncbi:pyrimidine reductase family protein [Phytomonospora sp. NPDC050363]|uniref:pyrimidine reductase family protein n=1 Tax=Phytomonospora sp. NPDC050363 TaxID=3155642 RepID=UPI0033ED5599
MISRLWPADAPIELSDEELIAHYEQPDRNLPHLRVNFVTSADGAVTVEGESAGLSSGADKRVFKILRMLCDVLVVGAGTVRAEGYEDLRLDEKRVAWRRDHDLAEQPVMAVVSAALDLDPASPLFTRAPVRPLVFTSANAPSERRGALSEVAEIVDCGESTVDFATMRRELSERGLNQMLCEGGPHILGELTAADSLDELCLTLAPLLAGAGAGRITAGPASPVRSLRLAHAFHADGNLILRYVRAVTAG